MDAETLDPRGTLWAYEPTSQIFARCSKCKCCMRRSYEQSKREPEKYPQGRPLGALAAWLHLECGGDPEVHKAMFTDAYLPYDNRWYYRQCCKKDEDFVPLFCLERGRFPWEIAEGYGEPKFLC